MSNDLSKNADVIRGDVPSKNNYLDYRDDLRNDFWYSCAYCTITEVEAMGIGFEIDHYYPRSKFPELRNIYNNLLWSCRICNNYKSNYYPDENAKEKKLYILRPDEYCFSDHIKRTDFRLLGLSIQGKFTIEMLYLNRLAMRRIRELRERFANVDEFIAQGIKALNSLRIDGVHPRRRYVFIELRKKLIEQLTKTEESFDIITKQFARSPVLDADPNRPHDMRKRKEFLKKHKAIFPRRAKYGKRRTS